MAILFGLWIFFSFLSWRGRGYKDKGQYEDNSFVVYHIKCYFYVMESFRGILLLSLLIHTATLIYVLMDNFCPCFTFEVKLFKDGNFIILFSLKFLWYKKMQTLEQLINKCSFNLAISFWRMSLIKNKTLAGFQLVREICYLKIVW